MTLPRLIRRRRRGLTPAEVYSRLYGRVRLGIDPAPRACPIRTPVVQDRPNPTGEETSRP